MSHSQVECSDLKMIKKNIYKKYKVIIKHMKNLNRVKKIQFITKRDLIIKIKVLLMMIQGQVVMIYIDKLVLKYYK